tara:strand:- start:3556 stop:4035 length:480 start_codon:yes stop_codon:yes gene_type:complete
LWHSLTESGEVEIVNIKFGNKVYEGVSVKHLKPIKMQEHSHKRTGKELDDKKKKKVKENIMNENVDELKKIVSELRKASKTHASQADRIDSLISGLNENKSIVEKFSLFMEKNVPTDPGKWSYYKSQAKKKFDVYPSAYANAWAAKQYKAAGGGWKKGK